MANVVKLKRGSGSDPSASDMVIGEPVIRTDTAELFFKKDDGTVAKVSGGGGGPDFKYLALRNSANNGAASYPAADFTLVTDGTTTAVTPAAAATLLVSYAGVIQQPSTGTSTPANGFALSGSTIKFAANIAAAPDFIIYQESGGIGEPSDNTVTTAKIVDDAVTADKLANSINSEIAANTAKVTNATHSGEVTGATALTIADNVVDEANLKVDNSPTNDYVLTAKSSAAGGLTWAAVSTTDSTKMPLAGGTFTGDVIWDSQTNAGRDMTWDESESDLTFNDAAYIQMGDSNDLTIGHNGTYSFITQTGSKLTIGSGGNHAVELLYGNAKKFETTSAGISVTGTITASSNINIGDSDEFIAGDSNDLRLWHNGTDSYIKNFTGDLYIQGDGDDIHMRAADDVNIYTQTSDKAVVCVGDGAVELYYDNTKKLETTSTGATITGALNIVTGALSDTLFNYNDGYNYITQGDDKVTYFRNESNTIRSRIDASGHYRNQDNIKLVCGTGEDLHIYHDGTDSTILNDEGILELRCNDIRLMNNAGNEHYVVGFANSYSALYYDNSKKIETKSDGVDITGELQCDSLDVDGAADFTGADVTFYGANYNAYWDQSANYFQIEDNAKIVYGSGQDLQIYHTGSIGVIHNGANSTAGHLVIRGDDIYLQGSNTHEELAHFIENGACELYYNNSKSLETNSEGIVIRGAEDNHGVIYLYADEGDDNPDMWSIQAKKTASTFTIQNNNAGAWDNSLKCHGDGAVELYYDNTKRFETNSAGTKVFGNGYISEGTIYLEKSGAHHHRILANDAGNDLAFQQSSATGSNSSFTTYLRIKDGGDISLPVDSKKLLIGAGDDLQLFHDGYNRICADSLYINNILNSETGIYYGVNNKVGLYYDGAEKFFTTSTGCEVSGYLNVTNSGLTAQIYHSGSGDTIGCVMRHGRGGLSGYAGKMIGFYGNDNTEEGSIVIGTAATAYNETSDYRLKENEVAISDGITRLKKLKPYRFNWKKDPEVTVDGFFAHEITPAVPEAVHGDKDATNSDGSVKPQQIDKSKLVPLLTAALQEAIGKIEVLETKVAALEAS